MAERRLTAAEHSHLATEFERIEKERASDPGPRELPCPDQQLARCLPQRHRA